VRVGPLLKWEAGQIVKDALRRVPFVDCNCTIEDRTRMLILSSLTQVEPLNQIEKEGGFRKGDQRGVAFATGRVSAGAQAVRDLIVDA
jgi:hypothetical protein